MKRSVYLAMTAAVTVAAVVTGQVGGVDRGDVRQLMRQKLQYAQAILEGVAVEDFQKIQNNAASLIAITSRAEWQAYDREDYLTHSLEFKRAVQSMEAAARRKNRDGAALGYVAMTMACVNCHKVVRDIQKAAVDVPVDIASR